MEPSILISVKKILGVDNAYKVFDLDIITHINSAFGTLNQLGVGPKQGFMIEDETATWTDFYANDNRLNSVRSYLYLKVRVLFDPPGTSYLIQSLKEEIAQLEWRLTLVKDADDWVEPPRPIPLDLEDQLPLL